MGVEDPETGELTLHEAGHAYALRQSVGGRRDQVEDFAMESLEWKQRKDALVNQFGSKKKKAAIRWDLVVVAAADFVVVVLSKAAQCRLRCIHEVRACVGSPNGGRINAFHVGPRPYLCMSYRRRFVLVVV